MCWYNYTRLKVCTRIGEDCVCYLEDNSMRTYGHLKQKVALISLVVWSFEALQNG